MAKKITKPKATPDKAPKTFVTYAKGIYGVEVDEDQAKELKRVWLDTFPEFVECFAHIIKDCKDTHMMSSGK